MLFPGKMIVYVQKMDSKAVMIVTRTKCMHRAGGPGNRTDNGTAVFSCG